MCHNGIAAEQVLLISKLPKSKSGHSGDFKTASFLKTGVTRSLIDFFASAIVFNYIDRYKNSKLP